jgi:hypothetical protein
MSSGKERIKSIYNVILNNREKQEVRDAFGKVVYSKIMGDKESLSKKTFVETFLKIQDEIYDIYEEIESEPDLPSITKGMVVKEKKLIKATENLIALIISQLPRLIILIGGPGAGKSIFYNKLITEYIGSSNFVYLNRDDIISMIPEYKNVINSNDYLRSSSLSDTITDDDMKYLGIKYEGIEDMGITYKDIEDLKNNNYFASGMPFNKEIDIYFNEILNKCLEDCIPLILDITGESYQKLEENITKFYDKGFLVNLVHIYRNTNKNEMDAIKIGIQERQNHIGRSILNIDKLPETYRRIKRNFENIKRMVNKKNLSDLIHCIECNHSVTDKKGKENMEDCQNSIIDHILTPDEKTKLMVNGEKKSMEKDSEFFGGNKTRKYSKRHIKCRKKKTYKIKRN